jgi:putative membrane protein
MTEWTPYCGAAPAPGDWLGVWNLDLWLIGALVVAFWGSLKVALPRRRGLTAAAFALMVVLFVSPLCSLSSALFSVRAGHHLLLVAAVAPLLAYSLPRRAAGPLILAAGIHLALFWLWHAPRAYDYALSHDTAFWIMQLSLLGSGVWFWAALRAASAPVAVVALLGVMVGMGLLGALITFAGAPLYGPHLIATYAWGLTPLQDQQLAGLIMWAPGALAYLTGAIVILGRWLGPSPGLAQPRP